MLLEEKMYVAYRGSLHDPTAVPAWGNLPTDERLGWQKAARVAAHETQKYLAAIDLEGI